MTKKIQNTVRAYQALFWICLVATAACAAAMILYGISAAFFAVNEIALLLCMSLYILHKKHHYTEAVEMINTTAANIEDTQLQLVAFNEHLQALNEFTKELSAETDRTEICKLATRMLVNKFKYDSSQFWLLNPQKDCLEFISASGYNDRIINQILADRTAENEQRLLYRVLSKKKMLIVRDVDDHSDMEDNDNYLFGKLFNLISFAVMPLLVDNKAIGVITIEYQRGGTMDAGGEMKSFDERDCLLLESLINFVGDVLAKTELFQDMEQQIEERTRELTKIKQKLLRTKELAIQSEK